MGDEHRIKLSDLNEKESATTETGDTCRLGTIVVANGTFAACEEAKELPTESAKALSARYYTLDDFASNDEPNKFWTCRAKLNNGQLCQRQDKLKCPFHGKIIARNLDGTPSDPTPTQLPQK